MTTVAPRFECKYCVPSPEAEAVLRVARVFLDIDRAAWPEAAADGPVPTQRVTSLYLDSPARTFYSWHLARRASRFKLRLRRYSAGRQDVTWAEVKHKVDGRVLKTRAPLPIGVLPWLESGDTAKVSHASTPNPALDDFLTRQRAFDAGAQVMLRCDRRGVRGSGNERAVGVTVDSALGFRSGSGLSLLDVPAEGWLPMTLPDGGSDAAVIVELKHGGSPPVWMRRVMTRLAQWQCSYSKYIAAMQAVAILEGGRR
jgi:hypothetical protein